MKRSAATHSNAARLFGYDLFISFALGPPPRGTRSYASDLVRGLRERDFTVFFSEDEAAPGEQPTVRTFSERYLRAFRANTPISSRDGTAAQHTDESMQSCGVIRLRPGPGTDPRLAEIPGATAGMHFLK